MYFKIVCLNVMIWCSMYSIINKVVIWFIGLVCEVVGIEMEIN